MSGNKVLIVDDDNDLLRALALRLKASGYSSVFATDGITAVSVARKEMPDVIILDINLPGADGFKVIERLGSIIDLSAIPIIVVTARDPSTTKEQVLNAGAAAFLQKPVDNDVLLASIQHALGKTSSQMEQKQPAKEEVPKSSKKILVVDDDKELLKALHVRLKANGYNTVFATDGHHRCQRSSKGAARPHHPRHRPARRRRLHGLGTIEVLRSASFYSHHCGHRQRSVDNQGPGLERWRAGVSSEARGQRHAPGSNPKGFERI